MTVLETVTSEMQVEKIILAEEIKLVEPLYQKILNYLADLSKLQKKYIDIDYINHDSFKELTSKSRAIIRTGEVTPYANIILISGVTF
jgi:D-ribose pyranase